MLNTDLFIIIPINNQINKWTGPANYVFLVCFFGGSGAEGESLLTIISNGHVWIEQWKYLRITL